MTASRLRWSVLIATVVVLASGCGGPLSVGQTLPISGDSFGAATVVTCLTATGTLHLSMDSTASGNPSYVKVKIDPVWGEWHIFPTVQGGSHFEASFGAFTTGQCLTIDMNLLCSQFDDVCLHDWYNNSTRSFHYEVSLIT